MANGIMLGTGTQNDPWIVADAWDFDSLRNLPATVWQWIEIENNIDLRHFPNWTPIPSRRFNINGNGKTIKNVRIVGSSGALGLFAQLETLETKDLRIEAEVTHTATGTSEVGILCGRLVGGAFGALAADPARTAVISNIQCFGNITVTVTGTTQPTGGCFGSTWGEANVTLLIENCAYYGNISCHITSSSTTAPSGTQLRSCGGILGFADARGSIANYSISLVNCISVVQFTMVGGTAHALIGGILGAARSGTAPTINGCLAKTRLLITNTLALTQPVWFGGILGAGIVACNITMCAAHFIIQRGMLRACISQVCTVCVPREQALFQ